ncbi:MAG TPA: haloacid dehalogenase-like hydrolase [Phycisphaerales bacterium]|nr:haloacid dehalogenase-like hydrolase [Phycisphaerales bacterium]HMP36911.1 haloacid dehalogenase-like hydrolase [Phycisphaerales bacterium]
MLVLFDIDGTMLLTERAGVASMLEAGRELFGEHFSFEGVPVAGRLDILIWRDLARSNGVDDTPANHDRFRARYGRALADRLTRDPLARALPGVVPLLETLAREDGVALGLLTGNYPETGRMKIAAAGIDPDRFRIAAWGIDGESRRELPPVAMRRHEELLGRPVAPDRVVIIGDTPHDVDCARHHGCRAIGVGTGSFPADELARCGADLALSDLGDTDRVRAWILDRQP